MKIAVDLDGVIWDLMTVFIKAYNAEYNENVKYENVKDWYYFPQERFEKIYEIVLKKLNEYPIIENDIFKYLLELNKNHDVQILTHEANSVKKLKIRLKDINIIEGIHYNNLIKDDPHNKKINYDFDIFIDDAPFMVKDVKNFPNKTLLLFDQPWNWYCNENTNVYRVHNWKDILNKIKELC